MALCLRHQVLSARMQACHQPRLLLPQRQMHQVLVRSSSKTDTAVSASSIQADDWPIPPGCTRYSISVKKPLGLVLEQNKATGNIVIAEISPEGNAARTGLVGVGDQLIATSGVTYSSEEDYNGAKVKKGQKVVRVTALGQSFKTVSAAIGSHPGHMEVKLEFQRCQ